jgi:hypothetical protein
MSFVPTSLEPIFEALFVQLRAVRFTIPIGARSLLTWGDSARRVKPFSQVVPDLQPAAYQAEYITVWQPAKTPSAPSRGMPARRILHTTWIIYFRTDFNQIGAKITQQIMDAVYPVLAPDTQDDVFTLGGLVEWCRIEGSVKVDTGDLDDQGQILIPLMLMVP